MPFKGNAIYGVNRTADELDYPQNPPDVRIAQGGSYVAYLLINGLITERRRDQIEQVVRTLNARGESVMALIIRDNNVVLDNDAREIDFADGIKAESVAPGVLKILIPDDAILNKMIAPGAITANEISNGAVGRDKLDRRYIDDIVPISYFSNQIDTYNVAADEYVTIASNAGANFQPSARPDALIFVTSTATFYKNNTGYVNYRLYINGVAGNYQNYLVTSSGEYVTLTISHVFVPTTPGFQLIEGRLRSANADTFTVRSRGLSGFMLAK